MKSLRFIYPLLVALLPAFSHAARPMVTDDARIVDAKACQAELWLKANRADTEYWALPSCNFSGNLELAVGSAITQTGSISSSTDFVVQGKTLFKTLEPNGWAWGLAAGSVSHPNISRKPLGDLYAYVPATFSFRDDRALMHINLGWLREKATRRNAMSWGIGGEIEVTPNSWLIAESYGENQGRPFYQLGLRHWIIHNRVQLDATYGNRSSGGEGWFSIGLRLLSPAFLP